jgi:hypothetical protein
LVSGLFFLRYWRDTGDRLFVFFALPFLVEGVNRTALALSPAPHEGEPVYYAVRLAAYALILMGIADKNRPRRAGR